MFSCLHESASFYRRVVRLVLALIAGQGCTFEPADLRYTTIELSIVDVNISPDPVRAGDTLSIYFAIQGRANSAPQVFVNTFELDPVVLSRGLYSTGYQVNASATSPVFIVEIRAVDASGGVAYYRQSIALDDAPPANSAPHARDDVVSTAVDTVLESIPILDNDLDADGDALKIVSLTRAAQGEAVINTDGLTVSYRPPAEQHMIDSFGYTISDGSGHTSTATVTILVASPFEWVGLGRNSDWHTTENWAAGLIPGAADVALFTDICAPNCDSNLDVDVDVAGMKLHATFPGTITQKSGVALNIGDQGYIQEAGAFMGTDGPIDINANVALLGGDFVSTSGQLSIGARWPDHNPGGLIIRNTMFSHNGGSVMFDGAKANKLYTTVAVVDVDVPLVLNDLALNIYDPYTVHANDGAVLRFAEGVIVEIQGDLVMYDGKMVGGLIELKGDIVLNCQSPACAEGSLTPVVMNGNTLQTYSGRGTGPSIVVDTTGSVEPDGAVYSYRFSGINIVSGTFRSPPGPLTLRFDHERYIPGNNDNHGFRWLGGNYIQDSTRYEFDLSVSHNDSGKVFLVDLPDGMDLPALTIDLDDYNYAKTYNDEWIEFTDTTVLDVVGAFTFRNGKLNGGALRVGGAVRLSCSNDRTCAGGGTTLLTLVGVTDQNWTQVLLGVDNSIVPGATLAIDKEAGAVLLLTDLQLLQSGQNLHVLHGTVNAQGHTIQVDGTLTLESGTVINLAGGDISYGNLVDNGGTINP